MADKEFKTISVLIVDDHAVVRQGLATFLELQDDIEVVGEASNGLEAIEQAKQLKPDIILMDLEMPQMDGIEATRQIRVQYPESKIIVLTSFATNNKIVPAIKAGASSYELKDVSPSDLVDAIRMTYQGETHLHPTIAKQLMENVADNTGQLAPEELTERELEVLRQIAKGLDNRQIAKELFISEKTVKSHISNILFKLDLESRTQAAIYALKKGLA